MDIENVNNISIIGNNCTGCAACAVICPTGCINMSFDTEGFRTPKIDETVCVNCGKCVKVCPAYNAVKLHYPISTYAATSCDEEGSHLSSSGGAFYEAAQYVIQHLSGYVCGAVLDNDLQLKHIVTGSMEDVVQMQGSKYIQSDIRTCYSIIQERIQEHNVVLFCGTPCQVAGIKQMVGDSRYLITMDLICHGTPSNHAFIEYMHRHYPEKSYLQFSFRQKNIHTKSSFSYCYKSKRRLNGHTVSICIFPHQDPFYQAFLQGANYRKCCYACDYAKKERVGDITIGDCANYRAYVLPLNKELSTVCINTRKGEELWNAIADRFRFTNADYEKEAELNTQLHKASVRPSLRNDFYYDIRNLSKNNLKRKYCPQRTLQTKIKDFFIWHTTPKTRYQLKQALKKITMVLRK